MNIAQSSRDRHCLYVKKKQYNLSNQSEFNQLIHRLNVAYYTTDEPLMTDQQFDQLLIQYEAQFGQTYKDVESQASKGNTKDDVILPYFLPSLDKITSVEKLENWLLGIEVSLPYNKPTIDFIATNKVDGLACEIIYSDPSKVTVLSRGSANETAGKEGKDISHIVSAFIDTAKTYFPHPDLIRAYTSQDGRKIMAIRGELVLTQANYEILKQRHPKKKYSAARNSASGLVTAIHDVKAEDIRLLDFMPFRVFYQDGCVNNQDDQLFDLMQLGFAPPSPSLTSIPIQVLLDFQSQAARKIATHTTITDKSNMITKLTAVGNQEIVQDISTFYDMMSNQLSVRRSNSSYEMDGLVLYLNMTSTCKQNDPSEELELPSHEVAVKFIGETYEFEVKNVTWEKTASRILFPRMHMTNIQIIDSAKIGENCSGYSGQFIRNNGIGPGARLVLQRSGSVIPAFVKLIAPSPTGPSYPDKQTVMWEWNAQQTQLIISDPLDEGVIFGKAEKFFKTLGCKDVAEKRIHKLMRHFKSVQAILTNGTSIEELCKIEGFKYKSAKSIRDSIVECRQKPISTVTAIVASAIFDTNFDKKRLGWIFNRYPSVLTWDTSFLDYTGHLLAIEGIGNVLAGTFLEKLPAIKEWLAEFSLLLTITPVKDSASNNPVVLDSNSALSISQDANMMDIDNNEEKKEDLYPLVKNGIFVFSEYRNQAMEKCLLEHGATEIGSTVTKKTTALIVKTVGKGTTKEEKAEKYGVPVFNPIDFCQSYFTSTSNLPFQL